MYSPPASWDGERLGLAFGFPVLSQWLVMQNWSSWSLLSKDFGFVALVVKILPGDAGDIRDVGSIHGSGRSLGEEMSTHSSIIACRIPWAEEPGKLQSVESQKVRHKWSNFTHIHTYTRDWGILERDSSPILCLASSVVILEINSQLGVLQKFKARPPWASLKPSGTVSVFTFLFLCTFLNYTPCVQVLSFRSSLRIGYISKLLLYLSCIYFLEQKEA